jgi:hypothetical protein
MGREPRSEFTLRRPLRSQGDLGQQQGVWLPNMMSIRIVHLNSLRYLHER